MKERLELVIAERRIGARTAALARRIENDYPGKQLSLVIVLKGAVVFAADLMRHLRIPYRVDFISAASYGADTRSSGKITLSGLDGLAIGWRAVLLVPGILDPSPSPTPPLPALH